MSADRQASSTASQTLVAASMSADTAAHACQTVIADQPNAVPADIAKNTATGFFARHKARIAFLCDCFMVLGVLLVLPHGLVPHWVHVAYICASALILAAWCAAKLAPTPSKEGADAPSTSRVEA